MAAKEGKSNKLSFQLKTPKGTRDWMGTDMILREQIFSAITEVFKRHGGTQLDTPVFELKEILAGKYGEDSRLIYDLADQGGEDCALRYDLTVPFARWLAMNTTVQHIKRFHIAKVYRRDQPAVAKGRMREFYQCDFDIAGTYDAMIPDAEVLRIVVEVFEALKMRDYITIKLNHRKILDGLFAACGVPEDKIRSISSAVDKLDKLPWDQVKLEMEEKGLESEVADKVGEYVKLSGGREILETIKADELLSANEHIQKGIADMELLFNYLEAYEVLDKVSFDLSLARGLDYYTGLIYEVVTPLSTPEGFAQSQDKKKSKSNKSDDPNVGVGSIAAGGRYDDLVNMFAKKRQIPCVGISFGVDRIFTIMKQRNEREAEEGNSTVRPSEVDVFVMAFGGKGFNGLLAERMSVANQLWNAGIKTEFAPSVKPRLPQQFKLAEAGKVPLAVILGEDELAAGKVKLKELGLPEGHPEKEGYLVSRDDLVEEIKKKLNKTALPLR
ncbi:Putative Histidyl-tRNA synthetase, mitochondrial (AFU_orthologue; AFUA_4G12920) [Aspergillus calidoustus]|uniref:Histidine--tRNA ligase, mitochondrial n=2 Tax=Aspergillus subgen. Nidulantes TaxID=2720870 RepID=A0A0U5C5F7_ASPCI|nr:Putative Histidyl-tRNA synthetase, mitochondrial (AFU_orthologue; AFUA_4G12920) [Aspergillus calidoustus]